MLLVIDVGNTQTALGLYFKGSPDGHWRLATEPGLTADERAVRWDDPAVGIAWPVAGVGAPILTPRDRDAPLLANAETYP